MKLTCLLAGLSLFAICGSLSANDTPSGHRVALLLGNSQYEGFTLPGVQGSLKQVEDALTGHGFRVTRRENLAEKDQEAAVEEFAKSVPTNGVALVYYIGLGAHVERFDKTYNLLRPVGENIASDNDYRSRGLDVAELIKKLGEGSGARVNLIFLDACWDSPIRPENGQVFGGLHEFEVGTDTLVMFAAGSGQTLPAPKGNAPSAFAQSLTQDLARLDASVEAACEAIAANVGKTITPKPWFADTTEIGIGTRSDLPLADALRDGKTPGEGFVNSTGMSFRWCPPGGFAMGSDKTDTAATRDRKPVQVNLSRGFWMGEYEVTQREYSVVMRKNPPAGFTAHRNAPFWGVSESKQITEFCKKLNDLERQAGTLPSGWEYVCPTEAEWEYACRAGSQSAFCFGDDVAQLGFYGNFADNALRTVVPNYHWAERRADDGVAEALAPVGSYRPNAWGLRDMHGNVAEVVADHLQPELPGGTDPLVKVEKNGKTQIRGGGWCSMAAYCESSFRNAAPGRDKFNFVGFRIALKKVK